MKILVLSDSHSALRFMRKCIQKIKPAHVIHLGDYYDDGAAMAQENPHVVFHQVPGNCDRYRCIPWQAETMCYPIAGIKTFMTHGHKHGVKSGTDRLLADGRQSGAQIVLYGHTHQAECYQDSEGMWVMNPGSCGSDGGSAGVIEIENEKITACYLVRQADMETLP